MKKLFKKSLAVIMVVVIALTAAPLNGFVGLELPSLFDFKAEAATQYTSGYYTYTVTDGEATITHCDKVISGDVTIPSTLGGYTVTKIGAYAFENCFNMTSVIIPNNITVIDVGSFLDCENLQEVKMPSNLTVIGDMAFKFCLILKNITIPESVTTIGDNAFGQCTSLTEITIPDNVTTLGGAVFEECYELTSISIGKGVKSIAGILFGYCPSSKLISINVNENNQYFSSDDYGVLFNKDKTTLIQYPLGNTRERYIIPDSVTTISYKA
ncbi:MAG: leucine-rich repeat domain-containing protein, partial [Clostridia bacterium]|nr:leucine-rich repeat domain-containing protein [Clostridia bacterium]